MKLELLIKDFRDAIKGNDRRIFDSEEEIHDFIDQVKIASEALNPRCKQIPIYAEQDYMDKKDLKLRGGMALVVDFYQFES